MSAAKAKEKAGKKEEEVKVPDVSEQQNTLEAPAETESISAPQEPEEAEAPETVEVVSPANDENTKLPEQTKAPEPPKEVKEVKTKEWIVCSGKSVTSKRGIIGAGSKVSPSDFPGRSDTMNSLKNRKIIELK